jgi:hypothetical protein
VQDEIVRELHHLIGEAALVAAAAARVAKRQEPDRLRAVGAGRGAKPDAVGQRAAVAVQRVAVDLARPETFEARPHLLLARTADGGGLGLRGHRERECPIGRADLDALLGRARRDPADHRRRRRDLLHVRYAGDGAGRGQTALASARPGQRRGRRAALGRHADVAGLRRAEMARVVAEARREPQPREDCPSTIDCTHGHQPTSATMIPVATISAPAALSP